MFFIGLNAYGEPDAYFDDVNIIDQYYRMELTDAVIDQIHMDNTLHMPYSTEKEEWSPTTLFLAKFKNNLEAGNIEVQGMNITNIVLKRRLASEIQWQTYITWKYDANHRLYAYYDKYAANADEYEYAVVPVAIGGIEGRYAIKSITAHYRDYFLMDKDHSYRLRLKSGYGNITSNKPSAVFLPMQSKYPIVAYNSILEYKEGSFSGLFYVDDYCNKIPQFGQYRKEAKTHRNNFISFLNNMKPKVLKDAGGNMWLINITDTIDLSFEPNTENVLCNITFQWTETGDSNLVTDLHANNLVENGVIAFDN